MSRCFTSEHFPHLRCPELARGSAAMRKLGLILLVSATGFLAGCSGSSNGPSNPAQTSVLAITTTGLAAGTVGAAYNSSVTASGGTTPYTYSASNLPNGLSISSATGAITGTP